MKVQLKFSLVHETIGLDTQQYGSVGVWIPYREYIDCQTQKFYILML